MADFDDLKLDKSAATPPPPPQPRWIPIVAIAALLIAFIAVWSYMKRAPDTTSTTPPQAASAQTPARETVPTTGVEVPPLDESDAFVGDLIRTLSQHPVVVSLLTTDQLIRTFAVSIHELAEGNTPAPHLHTIRPGSPLTVVRQDGRTVIDPRSYERFDGHAAAIGGIDATAAVRIYTQLKPRLEEAYREVAGREAGIDRAFERAITRLIETPVGEGSVAVQPAGVGYRYADPALESLPRAQQQLLRMGPKNARIVQDKLREIERELARVTASQ